MKTRLIVFTALLALVPAGPAHGAGLGVGVGGFGTDPIGTAHFQYRDLLTKLLDLPLRGYVLIGVTHRESGFFSQHGLEGAFLGGGYRFEFGDQEAEMATRAYGTALIMGFGDVGGGGRFGAAGLLGIRRSVSINGRPGGYFAEGGLVGASGFVTILIHVGLYAGT